jgi:O-antigen/teichoic acid export membrane protein
LGTVSLGYYSISSTAAGVISVIATTISSIAFVQIAQNPNSIDTVVKSFQHSFIILLFLALFYASVLPFLIPLVYGNRFEPSVIPAILLLFAVVFQSQGQILEDSLRGDRQPITGVLIRAVTIVLMLAMASISVDHFGMNGVIVSIILSQLGYLMLISYSFRKHFNLESSIFPRQEHFRETFESLRKFILTIK